MAEQATYFQLGVGGRLGGEEDGPRKLQGVFSYPERGAGRRPAAIPCSAFPGGPLPSDARPQASEHAHNSRVDQWAARVSALHTCSSQRAWKRGKVETLALLGKLAHSSCHLGPLPTHRVGTCPCPMRRGSCHQVCDFMSHVIQKPIHIVKPEMVQHVAERVKGPFLPPRHPAALPEPTGRSSSGPSSLSACVLPDPVLCTSTQRSSCS